MTDPQPLSTAPPARKAAEAEGTINHYSPGEKEEWKQRAMSASQRIHKIRHPQSRSLSTAKPIRHPQTLASGVVPAKVDQVEAARLKNVYKVFQRKYDIDRDSPWWKRLFFWFVYMPFARFAFFKLKIVPMDHVNEHGQLGWTEDQGTWSEEWRALQDAERYPFGGVERLAFNSAEDACTCAPRSQFPNSKARGEYEKLDRETVPIAQSSLERLEKKLTETDAVVHWWHRANSA